MLDCVARKEKINKLTYIVLDTVTLFYIILRTVQLL